MTSGVLSIPPIMAHGQNDSILTHIAKKLAEEKVTYNGIGISLAAIRVRRDVFKKESKQLWLTQSNAGVCRKSVFGKIAIL
jgi:hypothetical protein